MVFNDDLITVHDITKYDISWACWVRTSSMHDTKLTNTSNQAEVAKHVLNYNCQSIGDTPNFSRIWFVREKCLHCEFKNSIKDLNWFWEINNYRGTSSACLRIVVAHPENVITKRGRSIFSHAHMLAPSQVSHPIMLTTTWFRKLLWNPIYWNSFKRNFLSFEQFRSYSLIQLCIHIFLFCTSNPIYRKYTHRSNVS